MRRTLMTLLGGLLIGSVLAPTVVGAVLDEPGSVYVPRATQCVLFDTRPAQGGSGAIAGGGTRMFALTGDLSTQGGEAGCGVDAAATGYHLNLVAINPAGGGNLKAWPASESEPNGGISNYQALDPNMNNANAFLAGNDPAGLKVKANGASVDVRGILYGELFNADDRYALKDDLDRVLTGRVDINPHDFLINESNQDQYDRFFAGILPKQDTLAVFYAPVYLPEGATITRVVVVGTDNTGGDTSGFGFGLWRTEITPTSSGTPSTDHDFMASASSSGSDLNAVREIADTTIDACFPADPNCAVIDNTQYNYTIELNMDDFGPGIVAVYAAYIEYTLP